MRRRTALIGAVLAAVAGVIVALIVVVGGDDEKTGQQPVGRAIALDTDDDGRSVALVEQLDRDLHRAAVARVDRNGSLEVSDVALPVDHPAAMAVDDAGAVIVTGARLVDGERRLAVARVTAGGEVDRSFGTGGVATGEAGTGDAIARGIAVSARGGIVVVADAADGDRHAMAIARIGRTGRLASVDLIGDASAAAVAADRDGDVVAAGTDTRSGSAVIARLRDARSPAVTRGERFAGATWRAIATSPDAGVIVVGSAREDTKRGVVAVQRFGSGDRPARAEIVAVGQGDGYGVAVEFGPDGGVVIGANGSEGDAPAAYVVKRLADRAPSGVGRRRAPGRVAGVTPNGGVLTTHWDGERQMAAFIR